MEQHWLDPDYNPQRERKGTPDFEEHDFLSDREFAEIEEKILEACNERSKAG
jgi:hypothetical protein